MNKPDVLSALIDLVKTHSEMLSMHKILAEMQSERINTLENRVSRLETAHRQGDKNDPAD